LFITHPTVVFLAHDDQIPPVEIKPVTVFVMDFLVFGEIPADHSGCDGSMDEYAPHRTGGAARITFGMDRHTVFEYGAHTGIGTDIDLNLNLNPDTPKT
jgi:hypothetical protein